ncbi:MAG: adenylylsulfate kinase [Lachnospiraceae bacterium]|nr:adenylylsulfate kinase [Lachnospiraceae bacterium]MBP5221707.1 adenylylsulfate kinase [Lachnospiraceae bacterium]
MVEIMENWVAPALPENIPAGDMPGDNVKIVDGHVEKANIIFPLLLREIKKTMEQTGRTKVVVSVSGGSGVGKSGIAAVLTWYLNQMGLGSYTLSGDNYPRRIPLYNDAERLQIFRSSGIKGMIQDGVYTKERAEILQKLQCAEDDANPIHCEQFDGYASYLSHGREGLAAYLGTDKEINFEELQGILEQFHAGEESIWLKRMGRTQTELWYDQIDFSKKRVLILEWTHGNSDYLTGVDIPIFLNSTPQETLEYRLRRNRDSAPDSPFISMVLDIEQKLLHSQAKKAKIIVSRSGEVLSYEQYCRLMEKEDKNGKR